jgi:hypothetical protein
MIVCSGQKQSVVSISKRVAEGSGITEKEKIGDKGSHDGVTSSAEGVGIMYTRGPPVLDQN